MPTVAMQKYVTMDGCMFGMPSPGGETTVILFSEVIVAPAAAA